MFRTYLLKKKEDCEAGLRSTRYNLRGEGQGRKISNVCCRKQLIGRLLAPAGAQTIPGTWYFHLRQKDRQRRLVDYKHTSPQTPTRKITTRNRKREATDPNTVISNGHRLDTLTIL